MKYLLLILLFVGCHASGPAVVEGTYVGSFEHAFGIVDDTLRLHQVGGVYQIDRHSGVQRKLDGKVFAKELVEERWTLEYDAGEQVLRELKKGKVVVWDGEGLVLGKQIYHLLK